MRRRTILIGWPHRDPRHYRFATPNTVWEYKFKPIEFVIFSYLCYHSSTSKPTLAKTTAGVHMTAGTVKKYLDSLIVKRFINADGTPALNCKNEKFFTLPNEVFLLRLSPSVFMVYAYLLLIEDRRTHTCHPSYNTIAAAASLSKNTVMKSISALLEMGLITVESSSYFDKRGMKWRATPLHHSASKTDCGYVLSTAALSTGVGCGAQVCHPTIRGIRPPSPQSGPVCPSLRSSSPDPS